MNFSIWTRMLCLLSFLTMYSNQMGDTHWKVLHCVLQSCAVCFRFCVPWGLSMRWRELLFPASVWHLFLPPPLWNSNHILSEFVRASVCLCICLYHAGGSLAEQLILLIPAPSSCTSPRGGHFPLQIICWDGYTHWHTYTDIQTCCAWSFDILCR